MSWIIKPQTNWGEQQGFYHKSVWETDLDPLACSCTVFMQEKSIKKAKRLLAFKVLATAHVFSI